MIYLIRHGETNWNKEGRIQGTADIPLNINGIKQAMDRRKIYEGHHFTHVFTSPLERAKKTAEIITSKAKVDHFIVDEGLMEYDFGLRDGKTVVEDARELEANEHRAHPVDYKEEDEKHFIERISQSLLKAAVEEGNVMIVTHGGVISTLLRMLLPEDMGDGYIPLSNTSVCCIDTKLTEDNRLLINIAGIDVDDKTLQEYLSQYD